MLIYCYFNKKIYINWYFIDAMKIHPTLVPSVIEERIAKYTPR